MITSRVPIIKLRRDFIVSVQVALTDQQALQLKDDIADRVQQEGGRGLIIDLSGVDILDSYISRVIYDIGNIAHLMGVQAVICGLDPAMAMTLVEMGVDFPGILTELDLDSAIDRLDAIETEGADASPEAVDVDVDAVIRRAIFSDEA